MRNHLPLDAVEVAVELEGLVWPLARPDFGSQMLEDTSDLRLNLTFSPSMVIRAQSGTLPFFSNSHLARKRILNVLFIMFTCH